MGYRPENQDMEPPITDLNDAMDRFNDVADNQLDSGEWSNEHEMELIRLKKHFIDLKFELKQLL